MVLLEALALHRPVTPEKHDELLEDIHSATLRMSGMMEQVLLLGRAEAGRSTGVPLLDLPELCGKLVDEGLSATHRRSPVKLTVEGDFSGALMDEAIRPGALLARWRSAD